MSIFDTLAQVTLYGFAWLAISAGLTFVIAAAFFGSPQEKDEENQDVV